MKAVQSADGTTIAFDQLGKGPSLILVDGALGQRAMDSATAQLAPLLAEYFTVFHYDRRGRGDSTDTQPYAVAREIEDVDASRSGWRASGRTQSPFAARLSSMGSIHR